MKNLNVNPKLLLSFESQIPDIFNKNFKNILRKILESLSFFYKNKKIKEDKKIYIFINKELKAVNIYTLLLSENLFNFGMSICATCPNAFTPASVLPAP